MSFIIAAVQMTSGNGKEKNLRKAEMLLQQGVERGAVFLALPENFSFMGGEDEKIEAAEEIETGKSVDFLREFASSRSVWLLGGSIPVAAGGGKVFNTSLLIDDRGRIAGRYDKMHLFDVDLEGDESHRESRFVKSGDRVVSVDTPFGRVGLSICYDVRFPELYRRLTADGAGLVFVPAAFTRQTGEAHWEVLLRARAVENQAYVVAPAQFGTHGGGRRTYGSSMIVDPWGRVTARASDMETVITSRIEPSYRDEIRKRIPCLGHIAGKNKKD